MKAVTLLLALLLAGGCASARKWGGLAVHDARESLRAPLHAAPATWLKAGAIAAGVAASTALDDEVSDALDFEGDRAGRFFETVEPFGGRYSDRVMAGFLVYGLAARDARARSVAFDAFVSSVLASKVVTPLLKEAIHRERPSGSSDDSFPSNHATQAFAVASVVAAHYDRPWVDVTAYGIAAAVGAARIRHDAHFFSDVAAGAVIGTGIGRFITRTGEKERARWTLTPVVTPDGSGVMVHARW